VYAAVDVSSKMDSRMELTTPNHRPALDAAPPFSLHVARHRRGASEKL
jgi:hypothetical protein